MTARCKKHRHFGGCTINRGVLFKFPGNCEYGKRVAIRSGQICNSKLYVHKEVNGSSGRLFILGTDFVEQRQ